MNVFISYNHKDADFVRKLADALQNSGMVTWIDDRAIKIGDSIVERINEGIRQADVILVLISRNTSGSQWQSSEIAMAVAAQRLSSKRIVPVVIDKKREIPFFLKDRLYCDLSDITDINIAVNMIISTISSATVISVQAEDMSNINKLKIEKEALDWEKVIFEQNRKLTSQFVLAGIFSLLGVLVGILPLFGAKAINIDISFLKPTFPFLLGIASGVLASMLGALLFRKIKFKQNNHGGGQNAK